MAKLISPIAPSLPATSAIQDPAVRRFAQAVQDVIAALKSEEGAVESLTKATSALAAAGAAAPPGVADWLFSSELYQSLSSEIARVDAQAKLDLLAEAFARQTAIDEINATLAGIEGTEAYDPLNAYTLGDLVTYDGKLYQAHTATTGNLPTDTDYWTKVGDYASLGDVVAAHTLQITALDSRVTADEGNLVAEVNSRSALATQVRGSYTGTDITEVSQGLMYQERVARSAADSSEVAARESLSAKLTGSTDHTGATLETLTSGLIFEEKQARVGSYGALVSTIEGLEVRTGVTEGAIVTERNLSATNDLAIVGAVNTALAQITGVSTSISQEGTNLIANWSLATATKWSQIESEVLTSGGQTIRAALAAESLTRANADGSLYGQYTVKIDLNGYVAGFGLASESTLAGGSTSSFIIRADKFAMVMPGYGNHVPFSVGPSGVNFVGNTSGTIAGTPASTVVSNASNAVTTANAANSMAYSAVRPANPITPDNVATFINFAAIKNAQIGGDLYSDLYMSTGGTSGWYMQRHGNLYAGNAYIRGNVEASALKAGTAMVDTLHIMGNAITIPAAVAGSNSAALPYLNFSGGKVIIMASAYVAAALNPWRDVSGYLSFTVWRNGSAMWSREIPLPTTSVDGENNPTGFGGQAADFFYDASPLSSAYYSISVIAVARFRNGGSIIVTNATHRVTLVALGVRR